MELEILPTLVKSASQLSFISQSVAAGFPNPCEDFIVQPISLDDLMINRPTSTFLVRVNGDSMVPTIPDESILIVDKSVNACHGRIVVAVIHGEFVVKELLLIPNQQPCLHSHNLKYQDIKISIDESDWSTTVIWGVVTGFLKRF